MNIRCTPGAAAGIAALFVLATTGGCGTGRDTGPIVQPAPSPSDGVITAPAASMPPSTPGIKLGPLSSLPAAPTEIPADAADGALVSTPWQLLGMTDQGRKVAISYSVAGCQSVDHVAVAEEASEVVIEVLLRDTSGDGRPCPMSLMIANELVTLAAPLGSRSLDHAALTAAGSAPETGCEPDTCVEPQ